MVQMTEKFLDMRWHEILMPRPLFQGLCIVLPLHPLLELSSDRRRRS